MSPPITLEPTSYVAASRVFGSIADALCGSASTLVGALSSAAGMAGSDPVGQDWAAAYDASACHLVAVTENVINACYRLAALLEQTGFNWSGAESASTPGHSTAVDSTRWAGMSISLATPDSAVGRGGSTPAGWSLVESAVGYAWPNGHQDRLHRAADAWRTAGRQLRTQAGQSARADAEILAVRTPESDAALTACQAMRQHLNDLADAHDRMARECAGYAHNLDEVHSAVISELEDLVLWTAAIEAGGGLLSLVTFGLAEGPTQAAESARIAATAARIGTFIERTAGLVRVARLGVAAVGARAAEVGERVQALLGVRIVYTGVMPVRIVEVARVSRGTEAAADARLANAAARNVDRAKAARTDIGHAGRHRFPGTRLRKSQFFDSQDLDQLSDTRGAIGIVQDNGNTLYVMHARDDIGVDRITGLPTNVYTVIRNKRGRVVTMYPGTSMGS